MKQIKRLYVRASALLLVLTLCLSVPVLAAEAGTLKDTAEEAAASPLTFGGASSISWAVWQEGEITETGSLAAPELPGGDMEEAEGDLYGIGSVSKIYTTAAVLKLAEAGKLELDKPVTAYLPAFKMADERY